MSSFQFSQDFSQDDFNSYKINQYFPLQSITAGTRLHVNSLIFAQKLRIDESKQPHQEILTSCCWSESETKKMSSTKKSSSPHENSSSISAPTKLFYNQKIILSPSSDSVISTECNCQSYRKSRKCKHAVASLLLLAHKRRNGLPIDDTPAPDAVKLLETANSRIQQLEDENTALRSREQNRPCTADKEVQSLEEHTDIPSPLPHTSLHQEHNLDQEDTKGTSRFPARPKKPDSFLTPNKSKKRKRISPFLFQEISQDSNLESGDEFVVHNPTPKKRRKHSPSRRKSAQGRSPSKSSHPVDLSQNMKRTIKSLIDLEEEEYDEDYIDEVQYKKQHKSPKRRSSIFDFDVSKQKPRKQHQKRRRSLLKQV